MRKFLEKHKTILIFIFVIVIVVCFLFILTNVSHDENSLVISYSDDESFVISNALPMTDAVGKMISSGNNKVGTTGYIEFEVKSSVAEKVKYEIYLTKEDIDAGVPVKFVKAYLTDENDVALSGFDKIVPTYYDLRLSDNDPSGKLLYTGILKDKGSQTFRLRMWVADTYELTSEVRMFSAKLNVKVK